MLELRIHGRGGQGAQVGCQILAHAFFRAGRFVQAFAAYGGERRGAPVTAFLRIDDRPVRVRCDIERPGHALVLDAAMLTDTPGILATLPEGGAARGVRRAPAPAASRATRLAVYQTAFETTAAAAAGLSRAYRARGEDVTVVCLAGDGGTYDIGIQALSGAAERNEDFLYVCFDNEAYQNTGNQKSGATPWGARTTSTPRGKATRKKEIMEILAAHRVPYAATASPAFRDDLVAKVARAVARRGTRFLLVTCPCVPGWGIPDDASLALGRLAVESRALPLYEVEDGARYRITYRPAGLPVEDYLRAQGRYAHLSEAQIAEIQADVDRGWTTLVARAGQADAPAGDRPAVSPTPVG